MFARRWQHGEVKRRAADVRSAAPCRSIAHDWRQRGLNRGHLCRCCHARKQSAKVWMLHARDNVLPAVGPQHGGFDLRCVIDTE